MTQSIFFNINIVGGGESDRGRESSTTEIQTETKRDRELEADR